MVVSYLNKPGGTINGRLMRQWNCLCNKVIDLFEWTRNVPLITIHHPGVGTDRFLLQLPGHMLGANIRLGLLPLPTTKQFCDTAGSHREQQRWMKSTRTANHGLLHLSELRLVPTKRQVFTTLIHRPQVIMHVYLLTLSSWCLPLHAPYYLLNE